MGIPVIDLHADTYWRYLDFSKSSHLDLYIKENDSFVKLEKTLKLTLDNVMKSDIKVQTQSLYIADSDINRSLHSAMTMIAMMKSDIKNNGELMQVKSSRDINTILSTNKKGILISIEGLEVIENNLDLLQIYHELGIRMIAPTWNRVVPYVASCIEDYGFFSKGITLMKIINELGFLVDVSHMSIKGFFQAAEQSNFPIIASHSNCKTLNSHRRNLNDDQLKIMHEKNGLFGINISSGFLKPDNFNDKITDNSGFEWAYRHIDHAASHYSIDMVAIGTDYDGVADYAPGFETPLCFADFASFLLQKGFKREDIEKIFYKNFLRVFSTLDDKLV